MFHGSNTYVTYGFSKDKLNELCLHCRKPYAEHYGNHCEDPDKPENKCQ